MVWEKQPQINADELNVGCLNCSTSTLKAPMDMIIAVGFGAAYVTMDGDLVYDGETESTRTGEFKTVADIEIMAAQAPDHDWRIIKYGPLHGETFQRHGPEEWVCIESNPGFVN